MKAKAVGSHNMIFNGFFRRLMSIVGDHAVM